MKGSAMNFGGVLKKLRDNAELSQEHVAEKLGIARATYAGLENGRREPNLAELRSISQFYEISMPDLLDPEGYFFSKKGDLPDKSITRKEPEIMPRDINPEVSPEKLREVLLYILGKVGAKPNVGETVLYKLLYFIDFDFYEKHGKSITGLTYIRNHYGPTPTKAFVDVVKQMEKEGELEVFPTKFFNNTLKKYLPVVKTDLHELSAAELNHINEELRRLSDKTAGELSELSHYDMPWLAAKQGEPLKYRDVFYRSDITAVTEPEDEL